MVVMGSKRSLYCSLRGEGRRKACKIPYRVATAPKYVRK